MFFLVFFVLTTNQYIDSRSFKMFSVNLVKYKQVLNRNKCIYKIYV